MHALIKFPQYLVGSRFKVKIDHNSLCHYLVQKGPNDRQRIQAYDFDINYLNGKHNMVEDALSRRPTSLSLMSIYQDWKAQLLVEYSKDQWAWKILEGTHGDENYRVMDDVIYYKDHILLILLSHLRERIPHAAYFSPLLGHQGILKTYRIVKEHCTWKCLKGGVLITCRNVRYTKGERES